MKSFGIAAVALLFSLPAYGQNCAPIPEEAALKNLLENHGETPLFRGQMVNGADLLVTVNPQTKAWTILIIPPIPQTTCAGTSGTDFRPIRSGKPS